MRFLVLRRGTAELSDAKADVPAIHARPVATPVLGLPLRLSRPAAPGRPRGACRNQGIRIVWRLPGKPDFGGHIEQLIGTQMGAVHLLPDITFSNPTEREQYDSSNAAHMTLREPERGIGWEIAGHYHQPIHAGLHCPPIAVWREHEERLNFSLPMDHLQFSVSFLPDDECTLRVGGSDDHGRALRPPQRHRR